MTSGLHPGESSCGPVSPTPARLVQAETLPSMLKLRTMLDAGVVDLSDVYLLYRSIMYCGGSTLVLSCEGTPAQVKAAQEIHLHVLQKHLQVESVLWQLTSRHPQWVVGVSPSRPSPPALQWLPLQGAGQQGQQGQGHP